MRQKKGGYGEADSVIQALPAFARIALPSRIQDFSPYSSATHSDWEGERSAAEF